MAVNDRDPTTGGARGVDVYPGVANPTAHSSNSNPMSANFVDNPTTEDKGAGAGPNFEGGAQAARTFKQTAGVVEGYPGVIESTNIDPLNPDSNKDDGFANAGRGGSGAGVGQRAYETVGGAVKVAYGTVTGDEDTKKAGQEVLYGERP